MNLIRWVFRPVAGGSVTVCNRFLIFVTRLLTESIISVDFIQFVSCMFRLLHRLSASSHLVVQAAFACPSLAFQRSSQYRENFNSTIPIFLNGIYTTPIRHGWVFVTIRYCERRTHFCFALTVLFP